MVSTEAACYKPKQDHSCPTYLNKNFEEAEASKLVEQKVPFKDQVKHLGVILDKRLKWNPHVIGGSPLPKYQLKGGWEIMGL